MIDDGIAYINKFYQIFKSKDLFVFFIYLLGYPSLSIGRTVPRDIPSDWTITERRGSARIHRLIFGSMSDTTSGIGP